MAVLHIKNMVCERCKMAVRKELEKLGEKDASVQLGEVTLSHELPAGKVEKLKQSLRELGFDLIDDKKSQVIEKIKNAIVHLVHHSGEAIKTNLSDYLAKKVNYDYTYLSNLFSEIEGITIEKYFIAQRIERVKELLIYDEYSLSEIADLMGYSSVGYLSGQFKKVTGLTPSFFKSLKEKKRRNIEEL